MIIWLSEMFGTEILILEMTPSAAPATSFCLRDLQNYIDVNGVYQFLEINIESIRIKFQVWKFQKMSIAINQCDTVFQF